MTLRFRMTTTMVAMAIIPLVVAGLLMIDTLRKAAVQQNLTELESELESSQTELKSIADFAALSVELLGTQRPIQQFLSDSRRYRKEANLLVDAYLSGNPDHEALAILNAEGELLLVRGPENALLDVLDGHLREAALQQRFQRWLRCPDRPSLCLMVTSQVTAAGSDTTEASGYVASLLYPHYVQQFEKDTSLGAAGDMIWADAAGRSLVGQSTEVWPLSTLRLNLEKDGTQRFVQARAVAEELWVVGSVPRSALMPTVREASAVTAAIVSIAIVACVGLVMWLIQRIIVLPLDQLREAAFAFSRGNLTHKIEIRRDDEIGELGNAFLEMREHIVKSNDHIRELAFKDPLTGLQNRRMFTQMLEYTIQRSQRSRTRHGLLYLDLDNFKSINDTFGHDTGDVLLEIAGKRIVDVLRGTDFVTTMSHSGNPVARAGGDEFMILLTDLAESQDAGIVAQRLIESLTEPFDIKDSLVYTGASIGVAAYPEDGMDSATLLKHADMAMYHAKESGKNNFKFFSEELDAAAVEQVKMQARLRDALRNDGLELFYQPKINVVTGKVVGVEALARWFDAELGSVSPTRFIEVAEEHGLINDLTRWLICTACSQLAEWKKTVNTDFHMAINVSYKDIVGNQLPVLLAEEIERNQLNAADLTLELTESGLLESTGEPKKILDQIRLLGIQIALDDFGTGYSSLSYIRDLPIDEVKIDRSFLRDIMTESRARPVVEAVATLAQALGMRLTAEGVETREQLDVIAELRCDYAQGYLFSKPVNATDLGRILDGSQPVPEINPSR